MRVNRVPLSLLYHTRIALTLSRFTPFRKIEIFIAKLLLSLSTYRSCDVLTLNLYSIYFRRAYASPNSNKVQDSLKFQIRTPNVHIKTTYRGTFMSYETKSVYIDKKHDFWNTQTLKQKSQIKRGNVLLC